MLKKMKIKDFSNRKTLKYLAQHFYIKSKQNRSYMKSFKYYWFWYIFFYCYKSFKSVQKIKE